MRLTQGIKWTITQKCGVVDSKLEVGTLARQVGMGRTHNMLANKPFSPLASIGGLLFQYTKMSQIAWKSRPQKFLYNSLLNPTRQLLQKAKL